MGRPGGDSPGLMERLRPRVRRVTVEGGGGGEPRNPRDSGKWAAGSQASSGMSFVSFVHRAAAVSVFRKID